MSAVGLFGRPCFTPVMVITPAISVPSAVEGLVAPAFRPLCPAHLLLVLTGLFVIQEQGARRGSERCSAR